MTVAELTSGTTLDDQYRAAHAEAARLHTASVDAYQAWYKAQLQTAALALNAGRGGEDGISPQARYDAARFERDRLRAVSEQAADAYLEAYNRAKGLRARV